MMKKLFSLLIITLSLSFSICAKQVDTQDSNLYPRVQLETNLGTIVLELNRRKAPITVKNFISYVVKGEYNNTIFHRVVPGFVAQGGGYDTEFNERPLGDKIFNESGNGLKNDRMSIAMARMSDPHSAIRQFYFNLSDNNNLNPGRDWGYTVFGYVESGEEVIEKIAQSETHYSSEFGSADVPVKPIVIKVATLLPQS
ncbi:peptidyl-prolyl cis-trans isomerase A [Catenovulum agarivorans DS-2]|uniref:Peptidyl-prolyl cis-trans isomerase n=2 Tax=Catenovulum agarivorans TaxID=1172192 RepID=W7QGX9_9ALTE|nr:peptidyl-prolyl cis-trans isomerase A [Catenovulum agarivorans DS-2]